MNGNCEDQCIVSGDFSKTLEIFGKKTTRLPKNKVIFLAYGETTKCC